MKENGVTCLSVVNTHTQALGNSFVCMCVYFPFTCRASPASQFTTACRRSVYGLGGTDYDVMDLLDIFVDALVCNSRTKRFGNNIIYRSASVW